MTPRRLVPFVLLTLALCLAFADAGARAQAGEQRFLYVAVAWHPQLRGVRRRRPPRLRHRPGAHASSSASRRSTCRQAARRRTSRASRPARTRSGCTSPRRSAWPPSIWSPRSWSGTAPYEGGCDRMAISPDGKMLYVPSFEGPHWHVVDAETGDVIAKVVTNSGAHNTIYGPDGRQRLSRRA